jgi:hypothetical protein
MTFRARDIEKLIAFARHADIVNGTRIVEQLRAYDTQLSTFRYYGNFFVGKLLEIKHLGKGTFTDVGTTYKILRRSILPVLLEHLDPSIDLDFNAHFMDRALTLGYLVAEYPITFHGRVGTFAGPSACHQYRICSLLRCPRHVGASSARINSPQQSDRDLAGRRLPTCAVLRGSPVYSLVKSLDQRCERGGLYIGA